MNMDDGTSLIWGLGALMLVGSSLVARKLPLGETVRMALIWIAIFAAMFAVFSFRGEIISVWERVKADISGTANQEMVGDKILIKRGDDGHFSLRADVNGEKVDFLIDSGATFTALNLTTANQSDVPTDVSSFPVMLGTANGDVLAKRGVIAKLKIGSYTLYDHKVVVSQSFGDTNVLGMNFLDKLKSWKVEGNSMTLEPYQ